ncbi:hypothetical protein HK405_012001 [Cladochytrium tenue]|nr:hypothetical protein HK405_012001 [Cladochytrium tenue]
MAAAAVPPSAITMDPATGAASSAGARDVGQSATQETHKNNSSDTALPTNLLKNVQAGNMDLVKGQILEGICIKADIENRVGPENETILHFAILRNGKIAEMIAGAASDDLLAKPYENERYFGETALHLAVVQNRLAVIDILLGCGKLDLMALATGYEFVHGTEHKGTHYAGMTALQATNEGFAPAGELGAPHDLMELLSKPNSAGLTPSQMAAFFDNSGFLEAIRLNQWKFGTSSASVIKVELLSKVGQPTKEEPKPGVMGDGTNKKKKWKWRMTRKWHEKTPLEIACERRSKDFAGHPFVLAIFKAKWFLPPDVVGRFQYDYVRTFFEGFLFLSTIASLCVHARTSKLKYYFCGLVIVIFAVRIVVLLSHLSILSWKTMTDYADLLPNGNTTVDSLANGTGSALGSWLQLENFLFSAASICVWCNMLYFFGAFKSAGVLFRAFWEILADILTWSTMFVVFCLAFGGALFVQMEAADNDPWAPYWWTLIWVARVTLQSGNYDAIANGATIPAIAIILYLAFSFVMLIVLVNLLIAKSANTFQRIYDATVKNWRVDFGSIVIDIDNSLSEKARKYYDSHIGFRDFQGSDGTRDNGSFMAIVEINAKDGVPANVRKVVVGYWDEHYELDSLKQQDSPPAGSSTSSPNAPTAAELRRGGDITSSGAQGLSTSTTEIAMKELRTDRDMAAAENGLHTVVLISGEPSRTSGVHLAGEPISSKKVRTNSVATMPSIREQEDDASSQGPSNQGSSNQGPTTSASNTPVASSSSQIERMDPATSVSPSGTSATVPADTTNLPDAESARRALKFNDEYQHLLASHMPVELRIAEDYWAHWLTGLWHIFAVYWVWDVLRRRIPSFLIYKKADLDLLRSGGPPSDGNLWFGHPLVIRQRRPAEKLPEDQEEKVETPKEKVERYGDFALE